MAKLAPEDFAAVKGAVAEVEKRTHGEIVPLVVADAGDYGWARDRAALFGFVATLLAGEGWSLIRTWPLDALEVTLLAVGGVLVGGALGSIPAVARKIVGKGRLAKTVHRRALAEFTSRGCGNTRDGSGILVMVALFEHRIEIVADRGIQKVAVEKEGEEVWRRMTAEFSAAAADGRAVEGLLEVIRHLGILLEKYFPPDGENRNELPDALQTTEE